MRLLNRSRKSREMFIPWSQEDLKKNEMKNSYYVGVESLNEIPVIIYFDKGYLNTRIEFSVNAETWKVYFYSVEVGYIDKETGRIRLNAEECSN